MSKKQIIILGALVFFFVFVVIFGFLTKSRVPNNQLGGSQSIPANVQKIFDQNVTGTSRSYTSEIPSGATLTNPLNEAPASANPNLTSQIKFFDLKATANGYSPSTITVNQGDNLHVNFTAVDRDYDLDILYLGVYFSAVKAGASKELIFDTSVSGTFLFECRDACPSSGKIQGALIVLPKK